VIVMGHRILIVEDEMIIASELEAILEDLGFEPIGIAADSRSALRLAEERPDLALVDVNLRDGATGGEIGRTLSTEFNVPVLFVTANPRMLGRGVPGTIGVINKPYDERVIGEAVRYALATRSGVPTAPPPPFLKLFSPARPFEQADRR